MISAFVCVQLGASVCYRYFPSDQCQLYFKTKIYEDTHTHNTWFVLVLSIFVNSWSPIVSNIRCQWPIRKIKKTQKLIFCRFAKFTQHNLLWIYSISRPFEAGTGHVLLCLKFRFCHFFCHTFLNGGWNRSNWQKPLPNPKSLATFSHTPGGYRIWVLVRDS